MNNYPLEPLLLIIDHAICTDKQDFKEFWLTMRYQVKSNKSNQSLKLTSKQLLLFIWRCKSLKLSIPNNLLKLSLAKKPYKEQFKRLDSWEKQKLVPYMSKTQIKRYLKRKS